jgi:hypothetical protein
VVILLALFIADVFANNGAQAVLVPCLLLWSILYTLGLLNEDRPNSARFELFRLIVVVPVGVVVMGQSLIQLTPTVGMVVATYCLGSILWLRKN